MKQAYLEWIERWLKSNNPLGNCYEASCEMHDEFAELTVIAGRVFWVDPSHGQEASVHWWLEDEDGNIVDPTLSQFPSSDLEYCRNPEQTD